LHIEPDGGVARLRVHGLVRPDWNALRATGALVDLASVLHGGVVVTCNDMFFGPKDNLIQPGRGASMADGWETRRRREPGNDWIVVRLGRPGRVRRVEVDTAHFKGNFPDGASVEGVRRGAAGLSAAAARDPGIAWQPLLARQKLRAHEVHEFEVESPAVVDHVRLSIYPDGGVSRLRLWCEPDWTAA
jgi:allantoicase